MQASTRSRTELNQADFAVIGKKIAADKTGVAVTGRGFINVDIQMRTNVPHGSCTDLPPAKT